MNVCERLYNLHALDCRRRVFSITEYSYVATNALHDIFPCLWECVCYVFLCGILLLLLKTELNEMALIEHKK